MEFWSKDKPGTFTTLIGAKNEDELLKQSEYLTRHKIRHSLFFEPDIDQYTAIATEPLQGDCRKPLKRFSLMR